MFLLTTIRTNERNIRFWIIAIRLFFSINYSISKYVKSTFYIEGPSCFFWFLNETCDLRTVAMCLCSDGTLEWLDTFQFGNWRYLWKLTWSVRSLYILFLLWVRLVCYNLLSEQNRCCFCSLVLVTSFDLLNLWVKATCKLRWLALLILYSMGRVVEA